MGNRIGIPCAASVYTQHRERVRRGTSDKQTTSEEESAVVSLFVYTLLAGILSFFSVQLKTSLNPSPCSILCLNVVVATGLNK